MNRLVLVILAALAGAATLAATAYVPNSEALPVAADWKARADAWFESEDAEARKAQMRGVTRALRQPCKYCHTPDFTGYTDKLSISQQMMALTAEHGVPCGDCHAGKNQLTDLGITSQAMWTIAREKKVFCEECHVKGERFGKLTPAGERYKPEWEKRRASLGAPDPVDAEKTPAEKTPAEKTPAEKTPAPSP